MATVALEARREAGAGGWFRVLQRRRTYTSWLYLALLLPLTVIYVWIFDSCWQAITQGGLVYLEVIFFLLVVSWPSALIERSLATGLLGTRFTPLGQSLPHRAPVWERVKAHLRNPVTWKSMAYLAARAPFSLVAAAVALLAVIAPLALMAAPFAYLGLVTLAAIPARQGEFMGAVGAITGSPPQVAHLQGIAVALAMGVGGALLLVPAAYLVTVAAAGWAWFAQLTLGLNPKDAQLAEARAIATAAGARAEQAERGRRQLILDASHELRTPVATIRAHIDSLLLLEGERLSEPVRAYVGVMQREAERLSLLVGDLLMLARADADELRLDVRPVEVGWVVEEVYTSLASLAEREREVTMVRQVADGLPLVYADPERLTQALVNLTRNAITYTPTGGLVALAATAGADGATVSLAVTDTGVGIPEEDLERVFERFYRADASRARDSGGFGLGLSIVRDLVEAMGGSVAAERMPEGGSRFRIILRAATER